MSLCNRKDLFLDLEKAIVICREGGDLTVKILKIILLLVCRRQLMWSCSKHFQYLQIAVHNTKNDGLSVCIDVSSCV